MTISLGGYNFESVKHGTLLAPPYAVQESVQSWWGVSGAAILLGKQTVRENTIEVTFTGYTSESDLRSAVATMQGHVGDNGTLDVDGVSWPKSYFKGFMPDGPPFKDGSGVNGWVQFGKLMFTQHAT